MLFRVKSKPVFSMADVTARRKTRRGKRKGNRFASAKRPLFIPVWIENEILQNGELGTETGLVEFSPKKCRNPAVCENETFLQQGCEFFYSHWWNCTPFKKAQKLVRPPYMPIAPNNSTQYIIDNHFEIEFDKTVRDEVEENFGTVYDHNIEDERIERSGEREDSENDNRPGCPILSMGKHSENVYSLVSKGDVPSSAVERKPCLQTYDTAESNFEVITDKPLHLLETDVEYESPEDIDFFSFLQNDFQQTYEDMRKDKLLRLTKSELISKLMELEKKYDRLQKEGS